MKEKKTLKADSKIKELSFWGAVALSPVILVTIGLYLRNMLPGQQKMLVYGDYTCEYLPFFRHFWDAVIHGQSPEYSFSMGMGSPMLSMYSIFAFSPFSIVPYLIKDVTLAAYITWMGKTALTAAFFAFFLIYDLKSRKETAFIFSLFYSLSSYMLIYYNNIHFMDILYILPLLMHFLVSFVKENKTFGLVICYTFSFINNFFVGYCAGFFSFLIYILMLWYFNVRGDRLKRNIKNYCFAVFTSVLLAMPVVLPAVMFVVQHMPDGSDFSAIPLQSISYIANSMMFGRKIWGIFDSMPAAYCGWPVTLLLISFFAGKTDKRTKLFAAIPVILLLICCLWHPAYIFMHLFNEPDSFPWRFSFLLIFISVCTAAYQYDHMDKKLLSRSRIISLIIVILCVGVAYFLHRNELVYNDIIPAYIFWLNIGFVLLHFLGDNKKMLLYSLTVLELTFAVYFQLPQTQAEGRVQQDIKEEEAKLDVLTADIKKSDNDFYRTSIFAPRSLNSSLSCDYNGMEYFCSFDNTRLNNALRLLGLRAREQQYNNLGNTEFTNMIFSVKYNGSIYLEGLFENDHVLPLAFSVTEDIKNIKVTEDPFETQQNLADAMTGNDRMIYEPVRVDVKTSGGIEIENDAENDGYTFVKTDEEGMGSWYTDDEEAQPLYMFIDTGVRSSGMFDQDKIVSGYPVTTTTAMSLPSIYRFYKNDENSDPSVYLLMRGDIGSRVTIKKTIVRRLLTDSIQGIYEELAPLGLKIRSVRDNRIQGSVTADEKHSVLFSSIPYDINWRIMIDGKECETYAVFNGAFLACDISPGEHEVEYIYKDSALTMGLGAFASGLLLLLIQLKNNGKKKEGSNEALVYDDGGEEKEC